MIEFRLKGGNQVTRLMNKNRDINRHPDAISRIVDSKGN